MMKRKQKEKAKGKRKVDEQDQSLGPRHNSLAQNLRSPYKQRYIDIMVPVQVAQQYFVIAVNIKNRNIHVLDNAKEDRGKDY
ncbi:hypothetical protein V2J09_010346 [Rumex salicifolius]